MRARARSDWLPQVEILRYAAFSSDPSGGNPAGVVLDATGATDAQMQAVATQIGFSETAFLIDRGNGRFDVRYFSPVAEVPFCGHATIAAAVAYAESRAPGPTVFHTQSGDVSVLTTSDEQGAVTATLRSVATRTVDLAAAHLAALLAALGWAAGDLDTALPPRVAYAGAWHPIIAARSRARLADLAYDFDALAQLMAAHDWTTIDLVWRESATVFHARNPFPPGGVIEDPATGAAAAALGGYLREAGLVAVPSAITVHQGADLGRPGVLRIDIDHEPGIAVTGTAVAMS